MSRKRKLIFGLASLVFLAFVALGTTLAINKKSKPALLAGMEVVVISKQNAFYKDPTTGRLQQVTLTSLGKVDREALSARIKAQPNSLGGSAFFYPAGDETILIQMGRANLIEYWTSYITTLGKPPSKALGITSQGKTEFSVVTSAKGSAIIGARIGPVKPAPAKKGP